MSESLEVVFVGGGEVASEASPMDIQPVTAADEFDPSEEQDLKNTSDQYNPYEDATEEVTDNSLQIYLNQIGKKPKINAEEEVALAKRIEASTYAEIIVGLRTDRERTMEHITTALVRPLLPKNTKLDRPKNQALVAACLAKVQPTVEDFIVLADNRTDKDIATLRDVVADGQRARERFYEANLGLVVSIAKHCIRPGVAFLDLIQEGNLGLRLAIDKFDYTRGNKFSTAATPVIRGEIMRAMAEWGRTIRIPVHVVEVINRLGRIQRDLLQELRRKPTPEELAKEMDITPEKVLEIQQYAREPVSLDKAIGDGDSELGDFVEDVDATAASDAVAFAELQDELHSVIATLSEREAGIIRLRFGLTDGQPRTLDEIGQVYGVSRERIRQIESKTMSKLRHPARSWKLREGFETFYL